jgi:hypothetical protein
MLLERRRHPADSYVSADGGHTARDRYRSPLMRFPAMRSVQAYTRDALQLHRPDLGEGHVDPR